MDDRILLDPKVCHGRPVIRGTRVPVAMIVGALAGGMTVEDVMREYDLEIKDVQAALRYADLVARERHYPLPS